MQTKTVMLVTKIFSRVAVINLNLAETMITGQKQEDYLHMSVCFLQECILNPVWRLLQRQTQAVTGWLNGCLTSMLLLTMSSNFLPISSTDVHDYDIPWCSLDWQDTIDPGQMGTNLDHIYNGNDTMHIEYPPDTKCAQIDSRTFATSKSSMTPSCA